MAALGPPLELEIARRPEVRTGNRPTIHYTTVVGVIGEKNFLIMDAMLPQSHISQRASRNCPATPNSSDSLASRNRNQDHQSRRRNTF